GDGRCGDSEVADVSVHLLRPVTDVGAHGGPEVGVGQPVLQVRLVLGDVTRLLTDPDDEGCSASGMRSVTLVEAAQKLSEVGAGVAGVLPDGRRDLVDDPGVALRHVVASCGHPLTCRRTGLVPARAGARDPPGPGGVVDLRHRVEARSERADAPRSVSPRLRLVRDDRRYRDVVLGAGRPTGRELRSEPEPVSRGVEDSPERAAARLSSTLAMRLRDELPP